MAPVLPKEDDWPFQHEPQVTFTLGWPERKPSAIEQLLQHLFSFTKTSFGFPPPTKNFSTLFNKNMGPTSRTKCHTKKTNKSIYPPHPRGKWTNVPKTGTISKGHFIFQGHDFSGDICLSTKATLCRWAAEVEGGWDQIWETWTHKEKGTLEPCSFV